MSTRPKIPDWLREFFSDSTIWIFYGYTNLLLKLYAWTFAIVLLGIGVALYAAAIMFGFWKAEKGF